MRVEQGEMIPGGEDVWLKHTDDDWLEPAYYEYINSAYDNTWIPMLFNQVESDELFTDVDFSKFAYISPMSDGFEDGVKSIIDALSKAAYDQLTYHGRTKNWGGSINDGRPADYYDMVNDFCENSAYDDANFITLDKSRVIVYGAKVGDELIKSDFTPKQFKDKHGNEDIIQCHTHRKYDITNPDAYCIYNDVESNEVHRKI